MQLLLTINSIFYYLFNFINFINLSKLLFLCEITIIVFTLLLIKFDITLLTSISSAFVASSKINISGLLYSALAIPILCFCPPEIWYHNVLH